MSLYEALLFVHILAAVVWLGGGFMLILLGFRAEREQDDQALGYIAQQAGKLGNVVFIPAALVVLVMGILLTIEGPWSFSQLWIVLGLAGFASSFVLGAFFLGPMGERIAAQVEADGGFTAASLEQTRKLLTLARIDYVLFFIIVAIMAIKPTGDDVGVLAAMAVVLVVGVAMTIVRVRSIDADPGTTPAAA